MKTFKSEFIRGYSEPANRATSQFLNDNWVVAENENGWRSTFKNPCVDTLKVVFTGSDTRPICVALVGTMAFHKGSPQWGWWQNAKRDGVTPNLPNLEEREDGLYAI